MKEDVNVAEFYRITESQVADICDKYLNSELPNSEFKDFLREIKAGESFANLNTKHPAWFEDLAPEFEKCARDAAISRNQARKAAKEKAAASTEEAIEHKMTPDEIRSLTKKLEGEDPCGGYVSRCSIYQNALKAGKINENQMIQAAKFYGSIWNYTGD